jgi:hypothetical protein
MNMNMKFIETIFAAEITQTGTTAGQEALEILYNIANRVGLSTKQTDARFVILGLVKTLLGFTSLLALIMVIYGGFIWLTAAGKEDRIKKGRDILVWATIGLVVLMAAWGLVTAVMVLSSKLV